MKRLLVFMTILAVLAGTQESWSAPKHRKRATAVRTRSAAAATTKTAPVVDSASAPDSASASTGPTTAAEFKKLGDRLVKKGQKAKAIEAYKESITLGGSDTAGSRMALYIGKNCYAEKKYEEALFYFNKVTGKASGTLLFKSMVGTSLQMIGKNDSAIAILEPFASNQKTPVASRKDMFRVLGDAYMANKKEDIALGWYTRYVRSGGVKTADMAYLIASAEVKTAPAKATLLYEGNIKSFPSDYRNYLQLGILQSKNKATLNHSVVLLKKAISLADTISSAWFEIGNVNQRLGKTEDALSAYRNCLKLDHNNLRAKISMGSMLLDKGSTEDAISYLELAHKQAPDSIEPMALLSSAYTRSGKPKKAVDLLLKIKAANPKDVVVRKQLVDAYQSSGQEQKAFEEVQGVLELERDRESLFPYAKMLVKMGKYDEAIAALEEILGGMPDDLEALMSLASVLRLQKKFDEAVGVYKDICSMDAKYAPALFERAEVHLEQGKVKWAEMFYQRALAADPQMALAEVGLAKLALLYNKKGDVELHLGKAAALAADDPVVTKAINDVRNPSRSSAQQTIITEQESGPDDESAEETVKSSRKIKKKRTR